MGLVNQAYNDRVRYFIHENKYGLHQIDDPEGWNEDDKEFARHNDYDGMVSKFSNNLRFVGSGKLHVNTILEMYGTNAKVRLIKEVLSENLAWERSYTGYLDLLTWEENEGKVSVKFNSGGLLEVINNRRNEKVEIERLISLKGKAINPLQLKKLRLPGRRIFLKTQYNILPSSNSAGVSVETNAGNTRSQSVGIPLNLFSQSHDFAHSVIPESHSGDLNAGTTGMMFYAVNDRTRYLNISLNYNFNVFFQQYENVQWCRYIVSLTTYENGISYNVKERRYITHLSSEPGGNVVLPSDQDYAFPQFTIPVSAAWTGTIELLEGESIALEILLWSDMYVDNNAGVRAYARDINANLKIEEDSTFPETFTNGILAHELLERLVTIMTGQTGNFKSDFFGRTDIGYPVDGPGAYMFFSHGHWIRQFSAGDELYNPFTTSFKEIIECMEVLKNISVGVEKIGFKERIVVEAKKYFYTPRVVIRLGKVSKLKKKVQPDLIFSGVDIGSEKGGDYEEVMGLEETNTSANFTSPMDLKNIYDKKSSTRWDTYGEEIIRRYSKSLYPTTDKPGDKDIWVHDAKKGFDGIYELKKWQDVLEQAPIGMFSPETSYNFLWSPVNLIFEHGWYINSGFHKNQMDKLIFGSSRGKSSVSTKRFGSDAFAENGNIPIKKLAKALLQPFEYEFEHVVDQELLNLIEGSTEINGKKIPNVYCLWEFIDDENQIQKIWFKNVKPNKEGKFTVTKANI